MVSLQGAGRPGGPAAACLTLVDEGRVELDLSDEILAEVRDVLTRPKTLQKFPRLTEEWVAEFIGNVERKSIVLAQVPNAYALPRDPKDERYLNVAMAANAEFLVSRDLDLLDLMKDAAFRRQFPGLTILDPTAFLKVMAARSVAEPQSTPEAEGEDSAK